VRGAAVRRSFLAFVTGGLAAPPASSAGANQFRVLVSPAPLAFES
jgi:hypothetical protein